MTCIRTTGRDPWTPRQARHHNSAVHGPLLGMDYPRARSTAWGVFANFVWALATLYAVSLWVL